jgi:antitoxin MazE
MHAKLRVLGNSRGIVIPKKFIDLLDLGDEVELAVEGEQLVIRRIKRVRLGWDTGDAADMTEEEREWVDADLSPEADAELWHWDGKW